MHSEPLVYLVTGANRGLGLAFTKALLERPKCIVFAGTRDPGGGQQLRELTQHYPERLHIVQAVSADEEGHRALRGHIQKLTGRLDIVIANAGLLDQLGPILSCSPQDMMKHYEVNTVGPLVLFQAMWPLLQQSQSPKFIPVSSAAGSLTEGPGYRIPTPAYNTSKAALNFVTRTLRMEHDSLTCFPLSPGPVDTDLARRFKEEGGASLPYRGADEVAALLLERIDEGTRETDAFVRFNGAVHAW